VSEYTSKTTAAIFDKSNKHPFPNSATFNSADTKDFSHQAKKMCSCCSYIAKKFTGTIVGKTVKYHFGI
jgi:hypothetical protein